jgi:hypothetical protein
MRENFVRGLPGYSGFRLKEQRMARHRAKPAAARIAKPVTQLIAL